MNKRKEEKTEKKLTIPEQVKYDEQIESLRAQIVLINRKYKEEIKGKRIQEQILEFNRLSVKSLPIVKAPKPLEPEVKKDKVIESAVLVGSCWHIGETINKQEMGGLNEYNFDIFVQRLQFLIGRTIKFTTQNMSQHYFEELHIILTGDMVSGIIHEELEASNQLNIIEQAYLGSLVTAQALLELAQAFPKIIVTGVVGNHGRVQKSKYFKHKQTVNWDFVFYNTLALLLQKQENIKFNIPMSFWAGVEIQGWKFLIMHGDLIRSWGSIPFYGINREVSKWVKIKAAEKDFFQYSVMSHFHTKAVLQSPTGEDILNGSLKGGDEYAIGLGFYNDPIQLLFGVYKKYGKSWELSINTKHGDSIKNIRYSYDRTKPIANQLNLVNPIINKK